MQGNNQRNKRKRAGDDDKVFKKRDRNIKRRKVTPPVHITTEADYGKITHEVNPLHPYFRNFMNVFQHEKPEMSLGCEVALYDLLTQNPINDQIVIRRSTKESIAKLLGISEYFRESDFIGFTKDGITVKLVMMKGNKMRKYIASGKVIKLKCL
jgi:hypothetical protein